MHAMKIITKQNNEPHPPVLLPPVIQPARASCQIEERMEGGLHGKERPLDQLCGHLQVLAHLANVAKLKHGVNVERVNVQDLLER